MKQSKNYLYLSLLILSLPVLWASIIYWFYQLNSWGLALTACFSVASFLVIRKYLSLSDNQLPVKTKKNRLVLIVAASLYCLLWLAAGYYLWSARTGQVLVSPWTVVGWSFFVLWLLATGLAVLGLSYHFLPSRLILTAHYLLSCAVAVLVYQVGYGFDPFIHQASEQFIKEFGAIYPKTPYYLGQYSLVVILQRLTSLPVAFLDQWLLPILAALFLPWTAQKTLTKFWPNNQDQINLLILLGLIPLTAFFLVTTPQGLAYLFFLIIVLLGLTARTTADYFLLVLLSLLCLSLQPIVGLPAIILVIALYVFSQAPKFKKRSLAILTGLNILLLPALFALINYQQATSRPVNSQVPDSDIVRHFFSLPRSQEVWLNFAYWLKDNQVWWLLLLLVVGIVLVIRELKNSQAGQAWLQNKVKNNLEHLQMRVYFIYGLQALALLLAYGLTRSLPFDFLINYERANYANRLLYLALFLLAPHLLLPVGRFLQHLAKQTTKLRVAVLIFLSLTLVGSLYLAYPRQDEYFDSRGYATSSHDLAAVNWIAQDAKEAAWPETGAANLGYIVLANQQVSAAALRSFGFAQYYHQDIFYYPIPTGAPLYQYYLNMVDLPSRHTMDLAMSLAGVQHAYLVLNDYWWAFDKMVVENKLLADSWQEIDQGAVYVFRYDKD